MTIKDLEDFSVKDLEALSTPDLTKLKHLLQFHAKSASIELDRRDHQASWKRLKKDEFGNLSY